MIYNLFGDVTPKLYDDIKALVEENPNDSELLINIDTYGGNLSTAFSLWDYLRSIPHLTVKTHVQGNCMSAGTVIALIATKENRSATAHSVFMCHSPLINASGFQDTETISSLADTMKGALSELISIYCDRTGMELSEVQTLVNSKREFYSSEALRMGFISSIDTLYNKYDNYNKKKTRKNMRKNFINALANAVIGRLLNESYLTVDGQEIELDAVEIGATAGCPDGVYELAEDGTVVTVENGQVTDIVKKDEETTETSEEELTNEGESEEAVVEEAQQALEEVATVAEEAESAETVEEVQEIAEQIEEIVKEQFEEVIAKYKSLQNLVKACGGEAKLKALANVKHEKKAFTTVSNSKNKGTRSIKELVALKRK